MCSRRPWWGHPACRQGMLWLGAVVIGMAFSAVAHGQLASLAGAGNGLGPVELIVEKVWSLERRAIEQGQMAAGTIFGGLATIHLMVVALHAVNRGDSLSQFVEQLLWTAAFGSAIALGPDWARSIVEFFRNVGRNVSSAPVTPQKFLDVCIELLAAAKSADWLVGIVFLLIAVLAGLLALVIFYQETESHIILGAGAVVLGFGGAAATRDIAIRYFRLALGSGLRLMVVEMLNAAVMDALLAGAHQAKTDGLLGLETATTLLLGLLIVLGFTILLPVVVHSLASGAISSTAETLLAGLPAMAAAGGLARMATAAFAGVTGGAGSAAAAALGGKGNGAAGGVGASQEASGINGGGGGGVGKRAGRGGAVPSKQAVLGQRSAGGARADGPRGAIDATAGSSPESSDDSAELGAVADAESPAHEPGAVGGGAAARGNAAAGTGGALPRSSGGSVQGRPPAGREAPGPRAATGGAGGGAGVGGALPASTNSEPLPVSFWLSSASGWVGSAVGGTGSGGAGVAAMGELEPGRSGGRLAASGAEAGATAPSVAAGHASRSGAREVSARSTAVHSSAAPQTGGLEAAALETAGTRNLTRGGGALPAAAELGSGRGSAQVGRPAAFSAGTPEVAGDGLLGASSAAVAPAGPRAVAAGRAPVALPGGDTLSATTLTQRKGRES